MNVKLILEKSATGYSAYSNELPGLVTAGENFEEIIENFNEVLEMQADYLEETCNNKEAEELRNATVSYFLDLETFFDYYSLFNKSELAKYLGINPSHLRRLSSASVELSEKKALQIKKGLHKLATELQQYNFA